MSTSAITCTIGKQNPNIEKQDWMPECLQQCWQTIRISQTGNFYICAIIPLYCFNTYIHSYTCVCMKKVIKH